MSRTLVIVLGTVLGLQSIRAFLPLLVYVLRDRCGWPTLGLGGLALALFATAFVFPLFSGPSRRSGSLAIAALALAGSRLALQLWPGDPAGSMVLAAAGLLAFLALLAAAAPSAAASLSAGAALLVGALVDAAVHAAAGTRDLHWGGPIGTTVTLALTLGLAVAAIRSRQSPGSGPAVSASPAALFAWGPFLLLHLEILGNVARFSARTGLPTALSGALLGLGLAAALRLGVGRGRVTPLGRTSVGVAAALLAAGVLGAGIPGWVAWPALFAAQLGAALLLLRATAATARDAGFGAAALPDRPGRRMAALGGGFLVFLIGLFAHYAGYDLALPGNRTTWWLFTAAALAAAALSRGPRGPIRVPHPRALGLFAPTLALLPLLHPMPVASPDGAASRTPADPAPDPATLRVVSFNLHNGYDERGAFAFDTMMEKLKAAHPDVVLLQEVSRGWVVNGSADLLELARERLAMYAVAAPSVSRDWGNAILARAPLEPLGAVPLPPPGLPLPRSVTVATFPWNGTSVRVLATHYHHVEKDAAIRVTESRFLAERFDAHGAALLAGDFNAPPDDECLRILRQDGWADVASSPVVSSASPAPTSPATTTPPADATFPSVAPTRRIDTIFFGEGLSLDQATVAPPWGSDHRAVIADFRRRASAPAVPGP